MAGKDKLNMVRYVLLLALLLLADNAEAARRVRDFEKAPHNYWTRPLTDRFTQFKTALESGKLSLDRSSEKAFVVSLLKALNISPATQTLVYSTTSLQLRRISPRNPRALYFNEDVYVGWVPGGQIEIASIDPALGGIFYIFDIPRGREAPIRIERSTRCFNCHAEFEIGRIPGLLIKSVIPGPGGGSLESFRGDQTGHSIPFKDRFGGWHLTGKHGITEHWGNLVGELSPTGLKKYANPPGRQFRWETYPVATSDVLAQLLHEHQVGFVNRAVKATYDVRGALVKGDAKGQIVQHADILTRYLLFTNEVRLPTGGIEGDPALKAHFLKNARKTKLGVSLRQFNLRTHLFKYRCSYMIHSVAFSGLPGPLKKRVLLNLRAALDPVKSHPASGHIPVGEKKAIGLILASTLDNYPK
ncbi:MAG: hypothetical protein VYD34_05235 [Verrucomicrobiota bacterium]|nr:hypothetical protein [Verrucomicrobiota bacterium]